jgi:hypothetical protein
MAQGSHSGGINGGGRGGNDAPVVVGGITREIPHGLLDFISDLEYKHTQELKGVAESLHESFFTTKDKMLAMELGFRQTFASGLVTALMTPIAIGVVEKMIPVFGSSTPSVMDNIFVFSLTLSYLIGYAYFLGFAATRFYGGYTHAMVRNLLLGIFSAAALKCLIIFVLFNFIYIKVMTEEHILWALLKFKWVPWLQSHLYTCYKWLLEFRGVLPWSAIFVVASTLVFCAIIIGCYLWALKRNKKLKAAGSFI